MSASRNATVAVDGVEGLSRYVNRPDTYHGRIARGNSRSADRQKPRTKTFRLEEFRGDEKKLVHAFRKWAADEILDLESNVTQVATKGSLREAVQTYLSPFKPGTSQRKFKQDALMPLVNTPLNPERPELGLFGEVPILGLRRSQVRHLITYWKYEPGARKGTTLSRNTLKGRIGTARLMYETLMMDEDRPYNPFAGLKLQDLIGKEKQWERRDLAYDVIERTIAAVRGEHHRLRLRVMAYTGLSQSSLMRITPRDLDLDDKLQNSHPRGAHVYFHPRNKGYGAPGCWMPQIAPAVDAFKAFAAAKLFGPFDTCLMDGAWETAQGAAAKRIKDAAAREEFVAAFPPFCRPYDLRHSFATFAVQSTNSLETAAYLLQHTTTRMTRRYALGAAESLRSFGVGQMNRAIVKALANDAVNDAVKELLEEVA